MTTGPYLTLHILIEPTNHPNCINTICKGAPSTVSEQYKIGKGHNQISTLGDFISINASSDFTDRDTQRHDQAVRRAFNKSCEIVTQLNPKIASLGIEISPPAMKHGDPSFTNIFIRKEALLDPKVTEHRTIAYHKDLGSHIFLSVSLYYSNPRKAAKMKMVPFEKRTEFSEAVRRSVQT